MRSLLIVLALGALALPARAVDNTQHALGLGVLQEFTGGSSGLGRPTQISLKVALKPRLEASVMFGMTLGHDSVFVPGFKAAWVLIPEKNMNLYLAGAVGIDLRSVEGLHAVLYQFGPGLELFASDWPHVGFTLEFGLAGEAISKGDTANALGTAAQTGFGAAGIHYYF